MEWAGAFGDLGAVFLARDAQIAVQIIGRAPDERQKRQHAVREHC